MVPRDFTYDISQVMTGQAEQSSSPFDIPTPSFQNAFTDGIDPNAIGGGAIGENLRNLGVGTAKATVNPGGDIQSALDRLTLLGGGTLYITGGTYNIAEDITISTDIVVRGDGIDKTILDFGGLAKGVLMKGTSGTPLQRNGIYGLTIQHSNNAAGLDIEFANYWTVDNVRIFSCDQIGMRVYGASNVLVDNCIFDSNTGDGFYLWGELNNYCNNYLIRSCISENNTDAGFVLNNYSGDLVEYGTMFLCTSRSNTGNGFEIIGRDVITLLNCTSADNAIGFYEDTLGDTSFHFCVASQNSGDGFELNGTNNRIFLLGNSSISNSGSAFDLNDTTTAVLVGNSGAIAGDTDSVAQIAHPAITKSVVFGGTTDSLMNQNKTLYLKNTSGGTLGAGSVVVLKSVANGDEVTTTTTQGDDKVVGITLVSTVNNRPGPILAEGKTTLVKVDGTTDIAVGDFLGTFTTAGIAMKAAAGDMAFAIALEAYTTDDSSGVIDALLISPRKI